MREGGSAPIAEEIRDSPGIFAEKKKGGTERGVWSASGIKFGTVAGIFSQNMRVRRT